MIYEYAVEPELIASCGNDPALARLLLQSFGIGTPRLMAEYPPISEWTSLSTNKLKDLLRNNKIGVREQTIATELIRKFPKLGMLPYRGRSYNFKWGWKHNAMLVHKQPHESFHGILLRDNNPPDKDVLTVQDLIGDTGNFWRDNDKLTISRTAHEMLKASKPMLSKARVICFVDPYFAKPSKGNTTTLKTFLEFLEKLPARPTRIEVHSKFDSGKYGDLTINGQGYRALVEQHLLPVIPHGLLVRFRRWEEVGGGQNLHDRYLLTDFSGLKFSAGFDEGDKGHTNDLDILSREQYELRWNQYMGDTPAFNNAPDEADFFLTGGSCHA